MNKDTKTPRFFTVKLTKKQLSEIRFGLDVNRDIYRTNDGRGKEAAYCSAILKSLTKQLNKQGAKLE